MRHSGPHRGTCVPYCSHPRDGTQRPAPCRPAPSGCDPKQMYRCKSDFWCMLEAKNWCADKLADQCRLGELDEAWPMGARESRAARFLSTRAGVRFMRNTASTTSLPDMGAWQSCFQVSTASMDASHRLWEPRGRGCAFAFARASTSLFTVPHPETSIHSLLLRVLAVACDCRLY